MHASPCIINEFGVQLHINSYFLLWIPSLSAPKVLLVVTRKWSILRALGSMLPTITRQSLLWTQPWRRSALMVLTCSLTMRAWIQIMMCVYSPLYAYRLLGVNFIRCSNICYPAISIQTLPLFSWNWVILTKQYKSQLWQFVYLSTQYILHSLSKIDCLMTCFLPICYAYISLPHNMSLSYLHN